MHDFIHMAANQLGVSEEAGQSATSGLLGLLQSKMAHSDFSSLTAALPGTASLTPSEEPAPSGGIPGLAGLASSLGRGTANRAEGISGLGSLAVAVASGGQLGALAQLAGSGLDLSKIAPFAGLFLNYVKSAAGPEMVSRILSAVPELDVGGDA